VNAYPEISRLEIAIGGKSKVDGPAFGAPVRSIDATPGEYKIDVTPIWRNGQRMQTQHLRVSVAAWRRYTYVYFHSPGSSRQDGSFLEGAVEKVPEKQDRNRAQVSVINAVAAGPRIDVSLNSIVSFSRVRIANQTERISLAPGSYQITALESSAAYEPLAQPVTQKFEAGREYVMIVTGSKNEHNVTIQTLDD
jgi:hypothetical protein